MTSLHPTRAASANTERAVVLRRGFHGQSIVQCGNEMKKMEDLKVGDVVSTGGQKVPLAVVRKIQKTHMVMQSVTVRPGVTVLGSHPIKTQGSRGDGEWIPAAQLQGASKIQARDAAWYNVELSGHVDTLLVSGLICAVDGTYCGPRFGWDENTRKTTRCHADECFDQRDELNPIKHRCVFCDIVHDENPEPGMQPTVPQSMREASGHGCYGERVWYKLKKRARNWIRSRL